MNGLLSASFTLIMQEVSQDCPLSMLLYVVATKVLTHFNENDVELKTEDQKIKIVNFAVNTAVFSGNINCFERLKPILGLYDGFQIKSKLSKRVGVYGNKTDKIGKMICFQFSTKALEISFGNSVLGINDWYKVNVNIKKNHLWIRVRLKFIHQNCGISVR